MLYSKTGRYRVTGVNVDAQTEIRLQEAETGATVALPELPPGEIRNLRFSNDDAKMAFFLNGDTSPSNLFVLDLEGQSLKRHTQALNPEIDPNDFVESEVIRYPSFDGLEIPAILYKP